MTPTPPSHPVRFAIQKARGKGWKTLEVGEELNHAKARFETMIGVNPRAYFRLIQLDYNADSSYEGMEFNWTLIELYDPTQKSTRKPAAPPSKAGRGGRPRAAASSPGGSQAKRREAVALPMRIYLAVIVIGALVGGLAYLHFAAPGR